MFLKFESSNFREYFQANFTDYKLLNRHSLFQVLIDLNEFLLMYLQTGKLQYILKINFCQKHRHKTPEITIVLQKQLPKNLK